MSGYPNALEAVRRLWADVEAIGPEDYPTAMAPSPRPLRQPGWFPVETGLYAPDDRRLPAAFPVGGLMVIGHHWGDIAFHTRAAAAPAPVIDPTSRNLDQMLRRAGFDLPTQVWRTNVFVGLRRDGMMGPISLAGKDRFAQECSELLGAQMSEIRPKVCLALGRGPIRVLGRWIKEARWEQFTNFRRLDAVGGVVLRDVTFGGVSTTLIGIVHPCIGANARHQWWCGARGKDSLDALVELAAVAVNGR
jgi:uracil-DNA glycosylase